MKGYKTRKKGRTERILGPKNKRTWKQAKHENEEEEHMKENFFLGFRRQQLNAWYFN